MKFSQVYGSYDAHEGVEYLSGSLQMYNLGDFYYMFRVSTLVANL